MLLQIELFVLAAMLVVMVAAWAYGLAVKNGGWTDVFWTWGTGVVLAAAAVVASPDTGSWMRWIVPGMIFLWALRLGAYLTPRVAKHPEDTRYAAFREGDPKAYPLKMLFVTLPQAPATALLGLSVVVAAMHPPALEVRYDLGLAVFVAAVGLEGISDSQMKAFRANPANKGKVMETGIRTTSSSGLVGWPTPSSRWTRRFPSPGSRSWARLSCSACSAMSPASRRWRRPCSSPAATSSAITRSASASSSPFLPNSSPESA